VKLKHKIAFFNAFSKTLIIIVFAFALPSIVSKLSIVNTDEKLIEKQNQVIHLIDSLGIQQFVAIEEDESNFGSYNILKEEFISLEQIYADEIINGIENTQRIVEGEIVDYRVLSYSFEIDDQIYLLEIGKSIATLVETEATLREYAFYFLILIIGISLVLDHTFTSVLLNPFNKIISSKLKQVKDPTNFDYEIIKTSTYDFQYLQESIHGMMRKIESAFLKERDFIANVSHELKTPISIIQSKLENLLSNDELSEESMMKIIECQKTMHRLKNIMNALLLISKIENDQYLKTEQNSLMAIIDEVVEEIEDRLEVKNITLEKKIEEDYLMVESNHSLMFTMLFNLINNAIKYNIENGKIVIQGYFRTGQYILDITDTGIGISNENLNAIFDRFKRLNTGKLIEGHGLGLPIVKTIASYHDISIDVSSKPKKGTRFRLSFKASKLNKIPVEV
jgi:signal transduction histidine kinase